MTTSLAPAAKKLERTFAALAVCCALGAAYTYPADAQPTATPATTAYPQKKNWDGVGSLALLANSILLGSFARAARRARRHYDGTKPLSDEQQLNSSFFQIDFLLRLREHVAYSIFVEGALNRKAREAKENQAKIDAALNPTTSDAVVAADGEVLVEAPLTRTANTRLPQSHGTRP